MPWKAFAPMDFAVSLVDWMVMSFSLLQLAKACLPILDALAGRVSFPKAVQLAKAFVPMDSTFFPMVTAFSFLHPLRAFDAMAVTLYFTPEIVTVAGMETFVTFLSLGLRYSTDFPCLVTLYLAFVLESVSVVPFLGAVTLSLIRKVQAL